MFIEQRQSVGRTYNAFTNKRAKLFLFNTTIPADLAGFGFDSSDRLAMYENAVAAVDVEFTINELGNFVVKNDNDSEGVYYKGSGLDLSTGNTHWLIPNTIEYSIAAASAAANELAINALTRTEGSSYAFAAGGQVASGDTITLNYDQAYDFDGLDYSFSSTGTMANFTVDVWDGGSWVQVAQVTNLTTRQTRIQFASTVNGSALRITFTANSSSAMVCEWLLPTSNNTSPAGNFNATQPVEWAALVFNPTGSAVEAVLSERPMVWFAAGEPLSPSTATLSSTTIVPGTAARLIHAEFSADFSESV